MFWRAAHKDDLGGYLKDCFTDGSRIACYGIWMLSVHPLDLALVANVQHTIMNKSNALDLREFLVRKHHLVHYVNVHPPAPDQDDIKHDIKPNVLTRYVSSPIKLNHPIFN